MVDQAMENSTMDSIVDQTVDIMVDLDLPFVGDQNVQVVLDPMDSTVAHMEVVPMDLPLAHMEVDQMDSTVAHMEVDPMDITVAHMEVDQMDSTVAPGLDQTVDIIVGLDLPFVGDQNVQVELDPMDSSVALGRDQTVDILVDLDLPFVGDQNVDLDPTVALVVGLILLWQEYWQEGPKQRQLKMLLSLENRKYLKNINYCSTKLVLIIIMI